MEVLKDRIRGNVPEWAWEKLVLWRVKTNYLLRFLFCHAMLSKGGKRALEDAVRAAFDHPHFTRVVVRLYPTPGPKVGEGLRIHWGAPITVTVWNDKVPVVGMSLDVHGRTKLRIWQLQGSREIEGTPPLPWLPDGMTPWHLLFVEAVMAFTKQRGYREVWLSRAEQLDVCEKHKSRSLLKRLKHVYNATARRLGFEMGERWWIWKNAPCNKK
jgi:hypothetical protein